MLVGLEQKVSGSTFESYLRRDSSREVIFASQPVADPRADARLCYLNHNQMSPRLPWLAVILHLQAVLDLFPFFPLNSTPNPDLASDTRSLGQRILGNVNAAESLPASAIEKRYQIEQSKTYLVLSVLRQ